MINGEVKCSNKIVMGPNKMLAHDMQIQSTDPDMQMSSTDIMQNTLIDIHTTSTLLQRHHKLLIARRSPVKRPFR